MNFLDIFIIIFIILGMMLGFKQGLLISLRGIISIVGGILAGITFSKNLAIYFEHNFNFITLLAGKINSKFTLPVSITNDPIYNLFFLEPSINFIENTTGYLAYLVAILLSFLIIFIITTKVLHILITLLNSLFDNGFLGIFNKTAGLVISGLKNFVIVIAVLGLSYPSLKLASEMGLNQVKLIFDAVNESYLAIYCISLFGSAKELLSF